MSDRTQVKKSSNAKSGVKKPQKKQVSKFQGKPKKVQQKAPVTNLQTHGVVVLNTANRQRNGRPVQQEIPLPYSTEQRGDLLVECSFESPALELAFATLSSFFISKGLVSDVVDTGLQAPWDNVYGGTNYLLQGVCEEITGGEVKLSSVPAIVNDLIAGLKPKSVPFSTYGKINYAWSDFPTSSCDIRNEINTGGGRWKPTFIRPGKPQTTWDSPAEVWAGADGKESELYAGYLRLLQNANTHGKLKIVEHGSKSVLDNDVSAFSRVYVYNGLQPVTTAGYWKSVESEVPITCPLMANYCSYGDGDERAAHHYTKYSGDSGLMFGLGLHDKDHSPFNKSPPVFKQIDFEEAVTAAIIWMVRLKEKYYQNTRQQPTQSVLASQPLPFSEQDFRIAFRQALISNFDTQWFAQFTATLGADSGGVGFFVPFQISGGTGPSPKFQSMMLPSIQVEALASLRARSLQHVSQKGSKQVTHQIPVWGQYKGDTPVQAMFQNNDTEVPLVSLFTPNDKQQSINLIDGTYGNTEYVNLNASYYQTVLADWNYHVELLSEYSEQTQAFKLDGGAPGFGTLGLTRIIRPVPASAVDAPQPVYYAQSLRNVANVPGVKADTKVLTKQGSSVKLDSSVKKPKLVGPGSMINNNVLTMTSNRRLFMEEEGFYANLVLPSIRTSVTEDALTATMYQTEVREGLTTYVTNTTDKGGMSMWTKASQLASMGVSGLAKQNSNYYTKIIDHLQMLSQAGMLSGILAGVVGSAFPAVKGIAETIAGFMPI